MIYDDNRGRDQQDVTEMLDGMFWMFLLACISNPLMRACFCLPSSRGVGGVWPLSVCGVEFWGGASDATTAEGEGTGVYKFGFARAVVLGFKKAIA
jgi:hypothetical protein